MVRSYNCSVGSVMVSSNRY